MLREENSHFETTQEQDEEKHYDTECLYKINKNVLYNLKKHNDHHRLTKIVEPDHATTVNKSNCEACEA